MNLRRLGPTVTVACVAVVIAVGWALFGASPNVVYDDDGRAINAADIVLRESQSVDDAVAAVARAGGRGSVVTQPGGDTHRHGMVRGVFPVEDRQALRAVRDQLAREGWTSHRTSTSW